MIVASSSSLRSRQPVQIQPSNPHETEDLGSSTLIAQLMLDDIIQITNSRKGKAREGAPLTDEELAFGVQREYWEGNLRTLEDRAIAEGLAAAIDADRPCLRVLAAVEKAAEDDRRAALALAEGRGLPPLSDAQRMMEDSRFFAPLQAPVGDEKPISTGASDKKTVVPNPAAFTSASTSNEGSSRSLPTRETRSQCTGCGDLIRSQLKVRGTCGHDYCPDCISDLIEACTHDESLYPPRCCTHPFAYETLVKHLSPTLLSAFDKKRAELDVPAVNRIYCPRPTCSAFLGCSESSDYALVCGTCGTSVCPQCKQLSHSGENCSENTATMAVRELARTEKWQTCPGCHAIVELHTGCYHMTCRCRTQFCYLCAVPWKRCTCRQWDESRLLETAERRVGQEMGRGVAAPLFTARVQEMANILRDNHNCDQHQWRNRSGPAECEECHDVMPQFIKTCRNCHLMACRRCALNRL